MSVVVEMTLGTTTWAWLCDPCATARVAAGWTVKRKQAIAWGCDDCHRRGEVTDHLVFDFVPTRPESFCPAPGWVAPKPPLPWPLYLELQEATFKAARLGRLKREGRK